MKEMQKKIQIGLFVTSFIVMFLIVFSTFILKQYSEFGPRVVENSIEIEKLDRNGNSVPDTIKLRFVSQSNEEITAFGDLEICLVNKWKSITNCQTVSYHYPIPGGDGKGHSIFKKGETTFVRYLYISKPKDFTVVSIRLKAIGENYPVMQRFVSVSEFNLRSFESLHFGKTEEAYPQYVRVHGPLE